VFNQFSGVAGGVALAIIMVPIVTRTVEEILRLVPGNLREASLALGVPQWKTIMGVVLPTAKQSVLQLQSAGAYGLVTRADLHVCEITLR
jgi:ABC-type phosphate transport system permease subunit